MVCQVVYLFALLFSYETVKVRKQRPGPRILVERRSRADWWKCCSCHGNDGRRSFGKWDQFVLLLKITWQDGAPPPLPLPPIQPCRAAAPVSYYKMAAQSPPPTRKRWKFVVRFYLFVSRRVATGFAARRLFSAEFASWIWLLRCERKIFSAELHFDANVLC